MSITHAIALGVVQGITEFFPISSSGHLVILQGLFGMREPRLAFDIFLHMGTMLSVLIYFRKDIVKLFGPDRRTMYLLIAASVPTFIIAAIFKDPFERLFGMPGFVGYMLLATGFLLIVSSAYSRISGLKKRMGLYESVVVGVAQGVAIIPGVSRSGATISAGMFCGIDGETACRFSFLLSIPAVAGASLLKLGNIGQGISGADSAAFAAGGAAAAITGIFAIKWLLGIISSGRFYAFGIYCVIAGISAIIFIR